MGMAAPSGEKMVAHVLCNGGVNAVKNFEYRGVNDCLAATKVLAGDALACKYGCLGFGSCVAACKFDAIHVGENGVAWWTRKSAPTAAPAARPAPGS